MGRDLPEARDPPEAPTVPYFPFYVTEQALNDAEAAMAKDPDQWLEELGLGALRDADQEFYVLLQTVNQTDPESLLVHVPQNGPVTVPETPALPEDPVPEQPAPEDQPSDDDADGESPPSQPDGPPEGDGDHGGADEPREQPRDQPSEEPPADAPPDEPREDDPHEDDPPRDGDEAPRHDEEDEASAPLDRLPEPVQEVVDQVDTDWLPVPLVPKVDATPAAAYDEAAQAGPPAPAPAASVVPASANAAATKDSGLSPAAVGAIVTTAAVASGAAAATQVGLGAWLRRWLWLGLFSRISKSKVLDHDTRQTILDHLRANPGASVTELRDLVGRSINSVTHHLRVLEANGLVRNVKSGRRRCFFAIDDRLSPKERVATATLTSESARRVYSAIERQPGICQRDLASALEITPTSVVFHARRLEEAGIIRRAREGRLMSYFPAAEASA